MPNQASGCYVASRRTTPARLRLDDTMNPTAVCHLGTWRSGLCGTPRPMIRWKPRALRMRYRSMRLGKLGFLKRRHRNSFLVSEKTCEYRDRIHS